MSTEDPQLPRLDHETARRELEKGIHRLRELTAEARVIFEQLEEGGDGRQAPGVHSPPAAKPRD